MYPSETHKDYEQTVGAEVWKKISSYVDEVYHQDGSATLVEVYGVKSFKEMISALCAYENKIPQVGYEKLYEDYKLYWETVSET